MNNLITLKPNSIFNKNVTNKMQIMIAHIKTHDGQTFETQSLPEHLSGTAQLASKFSAAFHNAEWGKLLGLWHDLSKYLKISFKIPNSS